MDETEMLRAKCLKIGDEIISSVKNCFPENASIKSDIDFDSGNYMAAVSWKLCSDKNRPNKRSKTIRISITEEFIQDSDFDNNKQKILDRFKEYISCKMKDFDPEHNSAPPPAEEWRYGNSEN